MKVISTNIAVPRTIRWEEKEFQTGLYKKSVEGPLLLEKTDVEGDHVIDRRYHGGDDKACYLYSADHYSFWKDKYPNLEWEMGMFGENLTVEGLNEADICVGDIYKIGTALVQVTQPRQPCFKLGFRFGTQKMVQEYKELPYPGLYVKVLKNGEVARGDRMELVEENPSRLSIADVYYLIYHAPVENEFLEKALQEKNLPQSCRNYIAKRHQV